MTPTRLHRGFRTSIFAMLLAAGACSPDTDSGVSDATEQTTVRMVEVLATPRADRFPFVEIRNDGEAAVDVSQLKIALGRGSTPVAIKARPIAGSLDANGSAPASASLQPHSLGILVDPSADEASIAEVACETPIVTTKAELGSAHAAEDDILSSTLALQSRLHCVPVFTVDKLAQRLASVDQLVLKQGSRELDEISGQFASAPLGVAFERRGGDAGAVDLSPIGSTPGTRNFYRSDAAFLDDAGAPLPLVARSASPWRVGDHILDLRREERELRAQGNTQEADARAAEADALLKGQAHLHNPLVEPFVELVTGAENSAVGSFFQLNEPAIIDAYIEAQRRGIDVKLTTDGAYMHDEHYTEGFARLDEAGIPLVFDVEGDTNRSALSHNKFMVVDSSWLWTGSFNPIEDEPARIHADNALAMWTPQGGELHENEFATMFGGKFGANKRDVGRAGGRFAVDGAPVTVRYSPGMTSTHLKKRGTELARTGDPDQACNVKLTSGREAIPERYRALEPCGGPYDLIVGEVARAKSSVYFVSFSISLGDLGDVMVERLDGAVDVRGVVDPTVYNSGVSKKLKDAGADVRFTPNSDPECPAYISPKTKCPKNPNKVWLHHKFILVDYGTDNPVVITGSHNMSESAESQNDETLLVIRDRAVAETYYRMFREAYDHPQTMGTLRSTEGLPGLAITEVRAAVDPSQPQLAEIANFGAAAASLAGLELWNRRGEPIALDASVSLDPGDRAVVAIGDAGALGIRAGTPIIAVQPQGDRPVIEPTTALLLRDAEDGRWIATFDPVTAEQNLPEGAVPGLPGSAVSWSGFDAAAIDALTVELLGINTTPTASVPTWDPKGFFSDWLDEHHVTPTVLVLYHAPLGSWVSDPAGTPGW